MSDSVRSAYFAAFDAASRPKPAISKRAKRDSERQIRRDINAAFQRVQLRARLAR